MFAEGENSLYALRQHTRGAVGGEEMGATKVRARTWLRDRRNQLGLTQREMAERFILNGDPELGFQQAVQRLENGTLKNLSPERVQVIARAYECSRAYVLGEEMGGERRVPIRGVMMDSTNDRLTPTENDHETVTLRQGMQDDVVDAIAIKTDRYMPRYEPGQILLLGPRDPILSRHYGRECLVGMPDGSELLKRVHPPPAGSPRRAVLLTSLGHQAPPQVDEPLWAQAVLWVRAADTA